MIARKIVRATKICLAINRFFETKFSSQESQEIIKQNIKRRQENFLSIIRDRIYNYPQSPYKKLLEHLGYSLKDVEQIIESKGIEGTLEELRQKGMFLTYPEFKCNQPVIRNSKTFKFNEEDFNNPFISSDFEARSGATKSKGTKTPVSFERLLRGTRYIGTLFDMFDLWGIPTIIWYPILPAIAGLASALGFIKLDSPEVYWFSMVDVKKMQIINLDKFIMSTTLNIGRLRGKKIYGPEFVDLNNAQKLLNVLKKYLDKYNKCLISSYVSAGVRIARQAKMQNLSLKSVNFFISGEPITEAKRKQMESTGANVIPAYYFTEGGCIGFQCPNIREGDDIHHFNDITAVISYEREIEHSDEKVNAFLFTSLNPFASKILLNVESDDYGEINQRKCGCRFDEFGYFTHISNIRSFEKLTGEGVTFANTNMIRIIEEVLPKRFGGDPTDYQLLEEEDGSLTRLSLLVNPSLGKINENEIIDTLFREFGSDKGGRAIVTQIWSQAIVFRIKRVAPIPTKSGKIFPFHILNIHKG